MKKSDVLTSEEGLARRPEGESQFATAIVSMLFPPRKYMVCDP